MPSFKARLSKLLVGLFVLTSLVAMPTQTANAALDRPTGVTTSRAADGVVTVSWTNNSNPYGYVIVIDSSGSNKNSTVVVGTTYSSVKVCYQFTGNTDVWVVNKNSSGGPTYTAIKAEPVSTSYVTSGGKPSCASGFTNKYDYSLTVDPNTGSGTATTYTGNDYSVTIPANTFTKTGYTFAGWTTNADGTGTAYADQATITLTANLTKTIYAKWRIDGAPQVTTKAASSVTGTAATLNGQVDSGTFTSGYFCKSTTNPGSANFSLPCTDTATATFSSPNFTLNLTGLTEGTKYYFELVGISSGTEYQGGVLDFTTSATVVDTTTAASSITSSGATLNGELSGLPSGSIADNYFLISTTNPGTGNHLNPSTDDSVTASSAYSGNPFTFTFAKSGLSSNTNYYYELVVVDTSNTKYFGGVINFKTLNNGGGGAPAPYVPHPPTITNISAPEVCALDGQLTISGTYLSGATVTVDGDKAKVLLSSYGEITVKLPDASVGTKEIKVTNADGSATTTVKYAFADTPEYVNFLYPETYKDRAFSYTFTAKDAAKYAISGVLPAGLTLNPLTGEISGTPTQTGDYVFTIIASNICDSAPLIVYMFVDKAFPSAYTCSVAFNVPASNNISDIKLAQLKTCLSRIPDLSPKYIDPVIFLSGGIPAGLTSDQALTHPRYLPIIDLINSMNLDAQIYYGAFNGATDSVQLNVYWPEPSL